MLALPSIRGHKTPFVRQDPPDFVKAGNSCAIKPQVTFDDEARKPRNRRFLDEQTGFCDHQDRN